MNKELREENKVAVSRLERQGKKVTIELGLWQKRNLERRKHSRYTKKSINTGGFLAVGGAVDSFCIL